MIGMANEHFKKITSQETQVLLNSKDILVKVLRENAERNKLKITQECLQDTAQYILNELKKINEVKRIEQVVHDEICDSYRKEYYEYRDRQFNAAFENAHSNWANNEFTKNFDPGSCKEIYDSLKASLIETYKKPFTQEYFKFLDSSVEEWAKQMIY
ncbi:hypothetical protein PCYB_022550 [Plasmodium cynomolgi strain B]|uniref:Uncharacterized protein n=1 Tax=Plasmodium cynomolgi (strain B) TaxID=1120755 RepID=K6URZ4_PLACD|nr:hypothetical protein PCYB_022550 [Plasmodium cynomolgi strain B]GAB64685.1 hypothetical protein PCYB_022550 [Plasmodium cynomolgi strain B]